MHFSKCSKGDKGMNYGKLSSHERGSLDKDVSLWFNTSVRHDSPVCFIAKTWTKCCLIDVVRCNTAACVYRLAGVFVYTWQQMEAACIKSFQKLKHNTAHQCQVLHSIVTVQTALFEANILSRPGSMNIETRQKYSGLEAKTRPKTLCQRKMVSQKSF